MCYVTPFNPLKINPLWLNGCETGRSTRTCAKSARRGSLIKQTKELQQEIFCYTVLLQKKMNGKLIAAGFWAGILSGCLLGIFLKAAESLTGKRVYTLLINIDFVPSLPSFMQTELSQFLLHLLVSFLIGLAALFLLKHIRMNVYLLSLTLSAASAFLYFPLTILSLQPTPAITDFYALFLWFAGHLLYGCLLGFFIKRAMNK